ncbi:MAG: peptidase MA family metallohydrolase [Polyangiaceae bacterium]
MAPARRRSTFASSRPARWFSWLTALLVLLFQGLGVRSASAEPEASAPPAAQAYVAPHDAPQVPPELVAARRVPPGFTSYQGGWLTIAYPVAMRDKVQPLIAEADSFRKVLSTSLGRPVLLADEKKAPPVWVIVARSPGEMASYAPDGYPPPAYASGVAYSSIGLVLLTIDPVTPGQPHVLEEVFRHELAHVALYDAVGGAHVPRWFNEGFAVHVSGESSLARLQTLWIATVANNLIPLSNIDNGFPADSDRAAVAYAQSADIVRYLLRKQDTERLDSLLERVRPRAGKPGQPFEAAFNDAYGTSLSQLSLSGVRRTPPSATHSGQCSSVAASFGPARWCCLGSLGVVGASITTRPWRAGSVKRPRKIAGVHLPRTPCAFTSWSPAPSPASRCERWVTNSRPRNSTRSGPAAKWRHQAIAACQRFATRARGTPCTEPRVAGDVVKPSWLIPPRSRLPRGFMS